ncbi:Na+/H+-dicarboxylate symporter [Bradyrhizobium sp. i1.3.1]
MSNKFTQYILAAMVLGIVMGAAIFNFLPDTRAEWASSINLIAMMFLRLIKMIIAPLVFATLVGGIAHMGSGSRLGRIFAKTMGWFVSASFVSLLLGLVMVNLLQPGANFPGTLPQAGQSTGLPVSAFSIEKFLTHLIPTSIADAMAQNEILQIVIFAVFFSVAMGSMPERSKPILAMIDDVAHIMLKVTSYVMLFAPLAVWAAITATVAKNGLGVLWKLIVFMGGFYLALGILWVILMIVGFVVIGPRYSHLLKLIREPLMIAFSTASSEAAYPKTLEGPDQVRRVVADLELRAAARLLLQSRRHDDVLHLREHLHRADLPHRDVARDAAGDARDVDDHLQGRCRRTARIPRGDRLDAVAVRHPRGRPADDHGH